jgi:glucose-6-phosphate dehydrogenase assembly protein OpcA
MQTIHVASIEKELNALWVNAGKEDDSGVTRACVLNLVVVTTSEQATSDLDELLTEVTAVHPSRAILVATNRASAESAMSAQVISRCTLPTATNKQVCCEQVTIQVSGTQINEVHSAVQSLLLSDLPVCLWWREVPRLTDKVFNRLVDMSSRVIIDSSGFEDTHGDLINFSVLLRDRPRWAAFSDLNWSRLTAWRALTSSFFDISEYRQCVEGITAVEIEYGINPDKSEIIGPRTILLTGWLASRLGLTFIASETKRTDKLTTFHFRKNERQICMMLKPVSREGLHFDHLSSIRLHASTGTPTSSLSDERHKSPQAIFVVNKSDDGSKLQTSVQFSGESRPGRVLGYFRGSESELIGQELEILSHDHVYEQAMLCAGDLLIALVQS